MSRSGILIVGAGPVGLALSLLLARQNVPSVVLDENEGTPVPRAARSCVLRRDTADLVAGLGCGSAVREDTGWLAWRTVRRRQPVDRTELCTGRVPDPASEPRAGHAAPAPPSVRSPHHLHQHTLQRELRAAAAAEGHITLVGGARLQALEQDASCVTAYTVPTPGDSDQGGHREPAGVWQGSHLIGCDGARSTVRKLLGIRFPGRTAVERYAVAAVRTELPWPGEALLHRDLPGLPGPNGRRGGEVTARPLPGGQWRLDWLLPPRGETVTPQTLLSLLDRTLTEWGEGTTPPFELLDTGVYTCHQRIARRWRADRVLLAGDAAHLLGALGTQAVDEGLRDAADLAWKLALVRRGEAGAALLDSYEAERRTAVMSRLRAVDQALPLVRGNGGLQALLPGGVRERRLTLLRDGHLGRGPLGAPAHYRRSPLAVPGSVPTAVSGTEPGGPVADVPVTALDGTRLRLRDRLGRDLLALLVAPGTRVWESRHWLSAGLMPRLAELVSALPLPTELLVTDQYPGTAAHTVLLIRPDGHLVAALAGENATQLHTCVATLREAAPAAASSDGARP